MMVRLGDTLPDMEVNTTKGKFKLHEWVGDGWGAIFSYPGEPLG
jgi:alkyl hydroperoxide reductase subunit AhpC